MFRLLSSLIFDMGGVHAFSHKVTYFTKIKKVSLEKSPKKPKICFPHTRDILWRWIQLKEKMKMCQGFSDTKIMHLVFKNKSTT